MRNDSGYTKINPICVTFVRRLYYTITYMDTDTTHYSNHMRNGKKENYKLVIYKDLESLMRNGKKGSSTLVIYKD